MSSLHRSTIKTITPHIETPESADNLNEKHVLLKFVLIGDSKTGKTSIVDKFMENTFSSTYVPTRDAVCYDTKPKQEILVQDDQTGREFVLQLHFWDTKGVLPENIPANSPIPLCEKPYLTEKPQLTETETEKPKFLDNIKNDVSELDIDLMSFYNEINGNEQEEKEDMVTYSSDSTAHSLLLDPMLFHSLDALILVYDITNKDSFENLNAWLSWFNEHNIDGEDMPVLLLGNKTDLAQKRVVSFKQARKLLHLLKNTHKSCHEVSAKESQQEKLKQIFTDLARKCIDREASVLQLMSSDFFLSDQQDDHDKTIRIRRKSQHKRRKKNNNFTVNTCTEHICGGNHGKQGAADIEENFCVVL